MKYIIGLAIALTIQLTVAAQQQYAWREGSSGGYKYSYVTGDPTKTRFYTLTNGLTLILSVNKEQARVQMMVGTRAGSNNDPADYTGLAHYLEHLLFKGTTRYGTVNAAAERPYLQQIEDLYESYGASKDESVRKKIYRQIDSISGIAARYGVPGEYAKMINAMGGRGSNALTWVEETVYLENVPMNSLEKLITLQAERFRDPVFRFFHTELETVYEEKNISLDDDNLLTMEAILEGLFPVHNYGQQSTLGTIEHLKRPSLKAIRQFYHQYYVPNNMAIVLVGDFDPDKTVASIDKAFAFMQPRPVKEYKCAPEEDRKQPVLKELTGNVKESVVIAFRLPGASDPVARKLATALNLLLSNGSTGLMDRNLVKAQKMRDVYTSLTEFRDYSFLQIFGLPKDRQSHEEVTSLLLEQIDALKQGKFNDSLMQAISINYELTIIERNRANHKRAAALMQSFIHAKGTNWDHAVALPAEMGKLTKKDIVGFANKYLDHNQVHLFKRNGQQLATTKVVKPAITPIIASDSSSAFLRSLNGIETNAIVPVFADYGKVKQFRQGKVPVLYLQNKENDLFVFDWIVSYGTSHDKRLEWAFDYLQFLGTKDKSAADISGRLYEMACSFSVMVLRDRTAITLRGMNQKFSAAIALMEDWFQHAAADEKAWEDFKLATRKRLQNRKTIRNEIQQAMLSYASYGAVNPFNQQPNEDDLEKTSAADMVRMIRELFSYSHTMAYYGPASKKELTQVLEQCHPAIPFFKLPPAPVTFKKIEPAKNMVLFHAFDMVQADINITVQGLPNDQWKANHVRLFNNYFGEGMGSVVFRNIRETKALAYSSNASLKADLDRKGDRITLEAYVGTQADKLFEAIDVMNGLIDQVPFSEKDFDNVKLNMFQLLQTTRTPAELYTRFRLFLDRHDLPMDYYDKLYSVFQTITLNDLDTFQKAHLQGRNKTYCIIGSPARIDKEKLNQYGDMKELTLKDLFGY